MSQSYIEASEYWFLGAVHINLRDNFSNRPTLVPPSVKLYWIIHYKVNT